MKHTKEKLSIVNSYLDIVDTSWAKKYEPTPIDAWILLITLYSNLIWIILYD